MLPFTEWAQHPVGNQLAMGVEAYLLILVSTALCCVSILRHHGYYSSAVGFEIGNIGLLTFFLFTVIFAVLGLLQLRMNSVKKF